MGGGFRCITEFSLAEAEAVTTIVLEKLLKVDALELIKP